MKSLKKTITLLLMVSFMAMTAVALTGCEYVEHTVIAPPPPGPPGPPPPPPPPLP
jgi:hypothetical protein